MRCEASLFLANYQRNDIPLAFLTFRGILNGNIYHLWPLLFRDFRQITNHYMFVYEHHTSAAGNVMPGTTSAEKQPLKMYQISFSVHYMSAKSHVLKCCSRCEPLHPAEGDEWQRGGCRLPIGSHP